MWLPSRMGGRPSYPGGQLRRQFSEHLRANRALLIKLALVEISVLAVATAVILLLWPSTLLTGYLVGALHAGFIAMIVHHVRLAFFARESTAIHHLRGAMGESSTSDELRRAKRQRLIWGWVDGITVRGGDIDHLVVTRTAGVWAIDTKWMSSLHHVDAAADAASKARRRAESVLRSQKLLTREASARHRADAASFTVRPLVVVWGAAHEQIPDDAMIGEVPFVRGDHLVAWLSAHDGEPIDERVASGMLESLERFRERMVSAP